MNDARMRFMFGKSTNKEEFLEFLKTKINPWVKYPKTTVLVMDNHRAHHSKIVSEWLKQKSYVVHFLPPYSSEFNPIERAWAIMKREWSNHLASLDF